MTTLATNMTLELRRLSEFVMPEVKIDVLDVRSLVITLKLIQFDVIEWPYDCNSILYEHQKDRQFKLEFTDGYDTISYAIDATDRSIRYWDQSFDINSLYRNFLNYPDNWINPKYWDAFCTVRGL